MNSLLAIDESVALAKLHQKLLQIGDNTLFKLCFSKKHIIGMQALFLREAVLSQILML